MRVKQAVRICYGLSGLNLLKNLMAVVSKEEVLTLTIPIEGYLVNF